MIGFYANHARMRPHVIARAGIARNLHLDPVQADLCRFARKRE